MSIRQNLSDFLGFDFGKNKVDQQGADYEFECGEKLFTLLFPDRQCSLF